MFSCKFCEISTCNFIEIETLAQVFSCELGEISKNTFFYRTRLGDCFYIKSAEIKCLVFLPPVIFPIYPTASIFLRSILLFILLLIFILMFDLVNRKLFFHERVAPIWLENTKPWLVPWTFQQNVDTNDAWLVTCQRYLRTGFFTDFFSQIQEACNWLETLVVLKSIFKIITHE